MFATRTSLGIVAAAALLVLTGCSGGGSAPAADGGTTPDAASSPATEQSSAPAADQSKAEACKIVQAQFQEVSTAGSSISSSDPQASVTAFKDLAAKVDTAFSSITNAEIAPVATKASDALNDYATFLEGVAAKPETVSGLSDQVKTLQTSFTDAATACAG